MYAIFCDIVTVNAYTSVEGLLSLNVLYSTHKVSE